MSVVLPCLAFILSSFSYVTVIALLLFIIGLLFLVIRG